MDIFPQQGETCTDRLDWVSRLNAPLLLGYFLPFTTFVIASFDQVNSMIDIVCSRRSPTFGLFLSCTTFLIALFCWSTLWLTWVWVESKQRVYRLNAPYFWAIYLTHLLPLLIKKTLWWILVLSQRFPTFGLFFYSQNASFICYHTFVIALFFWSSKLFDWYWFRLKVDKGWSWTEWRVISCGFFSPSVTKWCISLKLPSFSTKTDKYGKYISHISAKY